MMYPFLYFVAVSILLYCIKNNVEYPKKNAEFIVVFTLIVAMTDIVIYINPHKLIVSPL